MIKLISKMLPTAALRSSLRNFSREIKTFRRHRKGVRQARKYLGRQHLKLHIGCGSKIKDGWINIDITREADITLDVRLPLPFLDNSCAVIYSEHFLEHLDYPNPALSFLKECYRVLEPGGMLSVGVPDAEWPLAEYFGLIKQNYFSIAKERWHPSWCRTEMEHINYHFRQDRDHRFAYDFKTLDHALTSSGFHEVKRRDFDMGVDSEDRRLGTLYVNAKKPTVK